MADSSYSTTPANSADGQTVISALFHDVKSAGAAIQELRELHISADAISVISRDEDQEADPGMAGVAREEIGDEGLTYRASSELPNDEDLYTTEAEMTGRDVPVVTSFEVPPNEPLGGSDRLGLSRDSDMVRRSEADANADMDIYTDFPDEAGGINPDSPVAIQAGSNVQEPMKERTGTAGTAAVGAGLGGLAGLALGLAGLAIPGVGPFLAAGPLAAALGGALAGGAAGGIIGGLSNIGVPEEYAREYAAQIEQGSTLVSVRTDALTRDLVERVLTAHGGESIH
ncbi:MAG TPA: hypothetical protein VFG99_10705, partial [Chloroflexia bacterium]|nr:hypothetical protein [Chloroflexia bacterium]